MAPPPMAEIAVTSSGSPKVRMATGDGENSYATNSTLQAKAILENRAALEAAVEEICGSLAGAGKSTTTMVVADLGCSSGPNTLLVVSEVVAAVRAYHRKKKDGRGGGGAIEVQFFLNDLPGNDFNLVFQSLAAKEETIMAPPPSYVAGLPGSFYKRLFPRRSVHLFHSSYSLMWRSKVPDELSNGDYVNKGNIYIGKTTSHKITQLFREQFQRDLKLFLTLRSEELVSDGKMMLTFLGRKSEEMLTHGEVGTTWELLAKSLQCLVLKGLIKEEKLTTFNLPFYAPSVGEVEALIAGTKLFAVERIRVFESSWDPADSDNASDDEGHTVAAAGFNHCASGGGVNVARVIRAVIAPLLVDHFGEEILDELFTAFAAAVAEHLEKAKAKYPVIVVSLQKAAAIM